MCRKGWQGARRVEKGKKRIQIVVAGIGNDSFEVAGIRMPELPGAEILVPALLVKIGEQQEHQQGDESWQDKDADGGSAIH